MSTYDTRWDEAEAEVDRGDPWKPKDNPDHPNPLTIEAVQWVTFTHDQYGEGKLLVGRDRQGKMWSVLVKAVLQQSLEEGIVKKFSEEQNAYVEVARLGPVQPGEVVSMKYIGMKEGKKFAYENYEVSRKPALEGVEQNLGSVSEAEDSDDGIPFDDGVPD